MRRLLLCTPLLLAFLSSSAFASDAFRDTVTGQAAWDRLGAQQEEIARRGGRTPEELRALLLRDPMLRVAADGSILPVCPKPDAAAAAAAKGSGPPPFDPSQTFLLHSLPGANHVLYLDFDGHYSTGTRWSLQNGGPIDSGPYDTDGQPASFSVDEHAFIQRTWQVVAEDMAPFAIDVTTEEPPLDYLEYSGPGDLNWGMRIVHTPDNHYSGDGAAWLYSFYDPVDEPAYTFSFPSPAITGVISSHEAGHAFGLFHDGNSVDPREPGHGSGVVSWGPIMGRPFNQNVTKNVTLWNDGDYPDANNQEDDLAIITNAANGFGYRTDDHGDSPLVPTTLDLSAGEIQGQGIIEQNSDVDVFQFAWPGGDFSLVIEPFAGAPNLRVYAELTDLQGQTLSTSTLPDQMKADLIHSVNSGQGQLPAGDYLVWISGDGYLTPATGGFSSYGSLGVYTIHNDCNQNNVSDYVDAENGVSFVQIQHDPIVSPQVGGSFDVTAAVSTTACAAVDPAEVLVEYSVDGGAPVQIPMTDGGGGVFSATIPIEAGQEVSYFILAADTVDNASTLPLDAPASLFLVEGATHLATEFVETDWIATEILDVSNGDATFSAGQQAAGGNPGNYRETVHNWTTTVAGASISYAHVYVPSLYDASVSGAINTIDFSFDVQCTQAPFVGGVAYSPLVEQGGNYYLGPLAVALLGAGWQAVDRPLLTAADFIEIGGAANPDFSASGAPIRFGYATSNGGSGSVQSLTSISGIDNWVVSVQSSSVTGVPPVVSATRSRLHPATPNPFNPRTTIRFDMPAAGTAELVIYDVSGRRVRTLLQETRAAGTHSVVWSGIDDDGRQAASGVYLYRLSAGSYEETRRMVLLK